MKAINSETILKISVIILLCIAFSIFFNHLTQKMPLFGYTAPYKRAVKQAGPDEEDIYITFDSLIRMIDDEEIIIVDVRENKSYNEGHIPRAVSLPLYEFDDYIGQFLAEYPPFYTLVLYCSDIYCDMADEMYYRLSNIADYEKIYIYKGGFYEWMDRQKHTGNQDG